MKADFEKGTKICSRCKKELPIEMFNKSRGMNDGLQFYCKACLKQYKNNEYNTFGRIGKRRGVSGILKRDYELTKEQLRKREANRKRNKIKHKKKTDVQGILIWYDEKLNDLDYKLYTNIFDREYARQKRCAIRGYVGKVKPSEHFLFDFDLEKMLKDKVEYCNKPMKKWWKGNIRHWTVKDGIWKE